MLSTWATRPETVEEYVGQDAMRELRHFFVLQD